MRLSKPVYRNLQACRGRSDDEVERLTREVYQRRPKLAYYPVVGGLILTPVAIVSPRLMEKWFAIGKPWSLLIAGALFGIPMILFEYIVHFPAVNREMLRLITEPGAPPNGSPATPGAGSEATEAPPSES